MRYDFSPLFRSSVGFDRLSRMLDTASQQANTQTYPPYNIEKLADDQYRITMAVAGFQEGDLEMVQKENTLTVKGKARDDGEGKTYLHRGIAGRTFEHRFQLADHIKVTDATLENGMLRIELVRDVPEAMKPRTIVIGKSASRISAKAA